MSNAIKNFNGLNGAVDIEIIQQLADLAKQEGQTHLYQRLTAGLEAAKKYEAVQFNPGSLAIEEVSAHDLPGLEPIPDYISYDDFTGLNKAVSPDDIYQYITDLMINTIKKVGNLPWQRQWEKTGLSNGKEATNYESKKGYRGINFFLLNFEIKVDKDGKEYVVPRDFKNPYFLTFNQIVKNKGKLNKGAKGTRVVYFTQLFKYEQQEPKLEYATYNITKFISWANKNKSKISVMNGGHALTAQELANFSKMPILKYYNVFHAEDVTGIDWKLLPKNENASKSEKEKIEVAEAIIAHYPNPPKIIFRGEQPVYQIDSDTVVQTPLEKFKSPQSFYSVIFHELIHSTGAKKRLDRPFGKSKHDPLYAKEELVAEMGAVFLCAESGILFSTLNNSAAYIKGWNSRLVENMEKDNRFYFRSASAAQAAADHILDRDKEGIPAYTKKSGSPTPKKEATGAPAKKKVAAKVKTKLTKKELEAITLGVDGGTLPDEDFKGMLTDRKESSAFKKGDIVWFKNSNTPKKDAVKAKITKVHPVNKTEAAHQYMRYMYDISLEQRVAFKKRVPMELMMFSEKVRAVKPKLTKKELEAANPAPKAVRPKSISVASAIDDILGLDKYKGISKIQANILYKYFKDDVGNMEFDNFGSKKYYETTSQFEIGNLKKETEYHSLGGDIEDEATISLTEAGQELVQSIKNRVESKRNQKQNYALFDGLAATAQSSDTIKFNKQIITAKRNGLKPAKIFHLGKTKGETSKIVGNRNMTVTGAVLKKSMNKNKDHCISYDHLINLPDKLNDPLAIYKSKTDGGYIVLTEIVNELNKPVMVAIRFDRGFKVNSIKSLYSRSNTGIYQKWEKEGLLLYANKKSDLASRVFSSILPDSLAKPLLSESKNTKTKPNKKKKGLKSPTIEPKPTEGEGHSGEQPRPHVSEKRPLKASDVANMDFEILPLDEGWENLFQTAPKNMRIAVWAKPKNGKTAACCNFAAYLTKFGPILYNFADQGINLSTKNLIEMSGMDKKPNAFITTTDKLEVLAQEIEDTGAHHVVIDMINQYINYGVTPHIFKQEILQRFPDVGFTLVMEVTKAGDFKGDQAWTHLVDQLVTIDNYIMDTKGRYGNGEKITWEEGAQKYAPQRYAEIKENEAEASPEPEIVANTPESTGEYNFQVY